MTDKKTNGSIDDDVALAIIGATVVGLALGPVLDYGIRLYQNKDHVRDDGTIRTITLADSGLSRTEIRVGDDMVTIDRFNSDSGHLKSYYVDVGPNGVVDMMWKDHKFYHRGTDLKSKSFKQADTDFRNQIARAKPYMR